MLIIKFALGSSLASFFNLTIARDNAGQSIVFPRSHCDQCQRPLSLWEIIPVLGFILTKGKCRTCNYQIPSNYFYSELLIALLFIPIDFSLRNLFYILNLSLLIYLSLWDLKTMTVPLPAIILLVIINIFHFNNQFYLLLIIIIVFIPIYYLNSKFAFIGEADLDIILAINIANGIIFTLWNILIACLLALTYLAFAKRYQDKIFFVPFLTSGYYLTTLLIYK